MATAELTNNIACQTVFHAIPLRHVSELTPARFGGDNTNETGLPHCIVTSGESTVATQNAVFTSPFTPQNPLNSSSARSRVFDPETLPGDLETRLDQPDVTTLEVSEEQLVDLMRQLGRPEEDIHSVRSDVEQGLTGYHIVAGLDVRIGEHLWDDGTHGPQIAMYGTSDKLREANELLLSTPDSQPRWYEQSHKADILAEQEPQEEVVPNPTLTGDNIMAAKRSSKKGGTAVEIEDNAASTDTLVVDPVPAVSKAASVEQSSFLSPAGNGQPTDITSTQVKRQLDAMGNDTFRVAIRGPEGIKNTYELTAEELVKKVPYFKMMNVQGNDILVKPIGESNVVMIDGLNKDQMNAMHVKDGGPALAIQVSSDTFQAFVKVGNEAIPAQQRREVAKELTERFGGDQKAVTEGHYGRLAGFTNRDPDLTKENQKQPWVKVQSAKGEGLDQEEAAELLTSANVRVEEINKLLEQTRNKAIENFRDVEPRPGELNPNAPNANATVAFKVTAARLFERYGEGFDEVKADWLAAKDMSQKGWDKKDIAKAIEEASANVEPRKFDAMKEYANRTAGRAVAAVENERTVDRSKSLEHGIER